MLRNNRKSILFIIHVKEEFCPKRRFQLDHQFGSTLKAKEKIRVRNEQDWRFLGHITPNGKQGKL